MTEALCALVFITGTVPAVSALTAPQTRSEQKSGSRKNTRKRSGSVTKNNAKSPGKPKSGSRSRTAPARRESREEMQRRQEQTQKEIRQTQEQIRENERKVKAGLAELGKIDTDITATQKQVDALSGQVSELNGKISGLTAQIEAGEKDLEKMRSQYLKAVKKMRLRKGSTSMLAFVFSADNFNQGLRRMRYLRQFSEWRGKQSAKIQQQVQTLKYQTELLGQTKREKDAALAGETAARDKLRKQHDTQDAIVVQLKSNGQALRSHLQKKQTEANQLRNQIAAIIAEEQRKAEAERRRQEEAQRAEEQRRAEAERKAEQQRQAEAQKQQAENKPLTKQEKKAQKEAEKKAEKERRKEAERQKKDIKSGGNKYAEARKRAPRGNTAAKDAPKPTKQQTPAPAAGGFENQRHRLPYPVSGSFKITSPFGRHPLPSLPNVEYDNPGVDAETIQGASAVAVYPGRVSGVYMLPGYSTVVIVNHGNYYTVYGNIQTPAVKAGDQVKGGQSLGRLAADSEDGNRTTIHFEVWHNREKLNPADWLR